MTNVGPGTVLSFFVLSTVHSYEQQENKQQKSTVLSSNDDLENLEQFLKTQNCRDTVQLQRKKTVESFRNRVKITHRIFSFLKERNVKPYVTFV